MHLYIENQFAKSKILIWKGFRLTTFCWRKWYVLTDLGSAKNAKEDYEKDIVIAKT